MKENKKICYNRNIAWNVHFEFSFDNERNVERYKRHKAHKDLIEGSLGAVVCDKKANNRSHHRAERAYHKDPV